MQMPEGSLSLSSVSPSFNRYSSGKLAEIAARVIEELQRDSDHSWEFDADCISNQVERSQDDENHGDSNDDDFEFAFVPRVADSSPISADDIFYNGQIRPVYPIFDQSLLTDCGNGNDVGGSGSSGLQLTAAENETAPRRRRQPLKMLMFEERGTGSCSSSASDPDDIELDGVEPGSYCVWNPRSVAAGESSRKKSKSTGSSSKRWKLRDLLLLRSQSDGKDSLVFVRRNQSKMTEAAVGSSDKRNEETEKATVAGDEVVKKKVVYVEKAKRRTMLPYRTDIIGLLHNVNGVGRNLHPF